MPRHLQQSTTSRRRVHAPLVSTPSPRFHHTQPPLCLDLNGTDVESRAWRLATHHDLIAAESRASWLEQATLLVRPCMFPSLFPLFGTLYRRRMPLHHAKFNHTWREHGDGGRPHLEESCKQAAFTYSRAAHTGVIRVL
jgi:hypothetical protein